jgi:hypothetical protein
MEMLLLYPQAALSSVFMMKSREKTLGEWEKVDNRV